MNKSELIDRIAARMGVPRTEAAGTLDVVLECIIDGLNADGRVKISGFGSFVKRHRNERRGVKPTTGEPIRIPASNTCGFKAAPALRDRMDAGVVMDGSPDRPGGRPAGQIEHKPAPRAEALQGAGQAGGSSAGQAAGKRAHG